MTPAQSASEPTAVKRCQQCGERFRCLHGQPGCWCEQVTRRSETLALLRAVADDCLCPDCLSADAGQDADAAPAQSGRPPRSAKQAPDAAVKARGLPAPWAAAAGAFLLGAVLIGLTTGPVGIGAGAIAESALSHLPLLHLRSPLDAVESAIVWQVRAPRVVLGALVGGMLAVAGASYQGVFRNPLADPYLLGVAAGAGLGATLAIAYASTGGRTDELLPLAAFVGAVCAVAGSYALGRSAGGVRTTAALILAGVTVAAFMTAVQTFVQQRHSETLREVYSWILGGLSGASWHQVVLASPYVGVSSAVLLLHRRVSTS